MPHHAPPRFACMRASRAPSRAFLRVSCFVVVCFVVVCFVVACDVGQPLVGERDPSAAVPGLGPVCPIVPSCDAERDTTLLDQALPKAQQASFESCDSWLPTTCADEAPDPGVLVDAGYADHAEQDAGLLDVDVRGDDGSLPDACAPIALDDLDGDDANRSGVLNLSCTTRTLLGPLPRDGDDPGRPVELSLVGVRWTHANVRIEARAPLVLLVLRAELEDVHLSLEGLVTLRFLETSRLEDVRVVGDETRSSGSGGLAFELENAQASQLVVGGALQSFPGSVTMQRSSISGSVLRARRVELESVAFDAGQLQSDDVLLTDVRASHVRFDLSSALVAATKLESSAIVRCESLRMQGSRTLATDIVGCAREPLRAYGTLIVGGRIGGLVEGDDLDISSALLGVDEDFDLVLWSGELVSVNFCEHTGTLSLYGARIACSECTQGVFEDSGNVCRLSPAQDELNGRNYCRALDQRREEAELCEEPRPMRTRPHMGL